MNKNVDMSISWLTFISMTPSHNIHTTPSNDVCMTLLQDVSTAPSHDVYMTLSQDVSMTPWQDVYIKASQDVSLTLSHDVYITPSHETSTKYGVRQRITFMQMMWMADIARLNTSCLLETSSCHQSISVVHFYSIYNLFWRQNCRKTACCFKLRFEFPLKIFIDYLVYIRSF